MRSLIRTSVLVVATLGLLAGTAAAQEASSGVSHPFGLGLEVGAPTGLAAKYYLSSGGRSGPVAIQAGLGVIEQFGPDGTHLHLEVVWHPAMLTRQPAFDMPFYLGVGMRLLDHDRNYCVVNGNEVYCEDDDTRIGVRAPFGILMDFNRVPLDIFFELALVVDFAHIDDDDRYDYDDDDLIDLTGALGARYYF
jgi:hypothetical protein